MHKIIRRIAVGLAGLATILGLGIITALPAHAVTGYYFSNSTGVDTNPCTQALPCKTLAKASSLTLAPGDSIAFLRGDSWTGGLVIGSSGNGTSRINFYGYGTGARPLFTGGVSGDCIKVNGSYVTIDNLDGRNCGYAGAEIFGSNVTIKKSSFQNNATGIRVATGTSNVVIGGAFGDGNTIKNNNVVPSNSTSGAFGVLLNGPGVVSWNTISGTDHPSDAFGRDGGAVELFNASNSWVHHNRMIDNNSGVETGNDDGVPHTGNSIEYNTITSDPASNGGDAQPVGIIISSAYTATWIAHNSINLLGANSQGIVCSTTCDAGTQIKDVAVKAVLKALYVGSQNIAVKNSAFNGTVQGETLDSTNSTAAIGWVSNTDLHQTSGSPTINLGAVSNFATDLDNATVPIGAAPDAGAYEWQTADPPPPTTEPPPPPGDHIFAAVGDTCSTSGTTQQCAKTATTIAGFSAEKLFHLGDYQYQNAGTNGATYIAGYQAAFAGLHGKTIPVFGSTHDTNDGSGIWEGYPVSYMNSNGDPLVQGKLTDHQWGYSVDINNWHVVVFNYKTGTGDGGSVASVTADLDAHPSQCLLAITHGSMIGSPSSEHPTNESSAFKSTLVSHGVDLVLNGHQHWYERNLDSSGFTALTNGQGGIGHYSRTSTASTAQAYNDTSFGPIKLTLKAAGWESDFVPNAGAASFTDHASGSCGS